MPRATPLLRTGTGSPLVLLHGFTASWRIWKPVIAPLARHHDVLAPTLPGHRGGPAMDPRGDVGVAAIADGVEAILDEHGITSAHLCGNSLGGWLALELARRGRARSVVALAPAGGWSETEDVAEVAEGIRRSARMAGAAAPFLGMPLRTPQLRRALLRPIMERGDRVPAGHAAGILADAGGCTIVDAFADATRSHPPFVGDMSHVTAPVRVAWSQNDRVLAADAHARPLLDRVTRTEFVVLPGVGHTPMYDDPLLVVSTILEVTLAVDASGDRAGARA